MNDKISQILEAFGDYIPNPKSFRSICERPLPVCFWANTLRISPHELQHSLKNSGFDVQRMAWNDSGFRYVGDQTLAKTWQYVAGLFQIQEEVAMLPMALLNIPLDSSVLDLCAAPGNKTAQMSVMMRNTGTLIANDRNAGRMRATGDLINRLGLVNVAMTHYDGVNFPTIKNHFDVVMADVPCSCMGNFRRQLHDRAPISWTYSKKIAPIQKRLLKKSIDCAKPGGTVVYATCTLSPYENEAVVHELLNDYHGAIELIHQPIPGFITSEGMAQWQGHVYDQAVKKTYRVWPNLNNTGGFFVAIFRKKNCLPVPKQLYYHCYTKKTQRVTSQDRPWQRFQLPSDVFSKYRVVHAGEFKLSLVSISMKIPSSIVIDALGMVLLNKKMRFPKMTTAASQCLGVYALKNALQLNPDQLRSYLAGLDVYLHYDQLFFCEGTGYVLVFYCGFVLGMALLFVDKQVNMPVMRSLLPKRLRCVIDC